MKRKVRTKKMGKRADAEKGRTVGARIIEGLEQAIAWSRGEKSRARVTLIQVPEIEVQDGRRKMGLG